jgi:hypothetical protein
MYKRVDLVAQPPKPNLEAIEPLNQGVPRYVSKAIAKPPSGGAPQENELEPSAAENKSARNLNLVS